MKVSFTLFIFTFNMKNSSTAVLLCKIDVTVSICELQCNSDVTISICVYFQGIVEITGILEEEMKRPDFGKVESCNCDHCVSQAKLEQVVTTSFCLRNLRTI